METGSRIFLESEDGREIDERITLAARSLESKALRFGRDWLRDESCALELLERAARAVARKSNGVLNPAGYIWTSFSHLANREIASRQHEVPFDEIVTAALESKTGTAEDTERGVLVGELLAKMPPWSRRVWEWRLAHSRDDEIAESLGMSVSAMQERLSREMRDFREELYHQHKRR
jgi:DNA-directed RNA polymerase specialized sigma24 family protein